MQQKNLSNTLQDEKERKDGEQEGDGDQWKQSADELEVLRASLK